MSRVPPHLRRLLESPLDTFERLEILSALSRANAETMSARELTNAVDLPLDLVERALCDLAAIGVVEGSAGLARLAATRADSEAIRELLRLYDTDRIAVAGVLSERSMVRIRGMAARAFSDAFQPRKKPGDAP